MNPEMLIKVMEKLVGNITPGGETYSDNMAYDNQENLIELAEEMVYMLIRNSKYKDRSEYSVEKIGKRAHAALQTLYKEIGGCI